jgi:V/A-type H+-transporting ATPase subunit K
MAVFLAQLGLALPLALGAIGSSLGIVRAGQAAIGEWAKEGKAGKSQSFLFVILSAMPISQTIYGFMYTTLAVSPAFVKDATFVERYGVALFAIGLACGISELLSAFFQGVLGAAGCRALSEADGKGFAQIVIVMGIIETVGLFGLVFALLVTPGAAG